MELKTTSTAALIGMKIASQQEALEYCARGAPGVEDVALRRSMVLSCES